MQRTPSRLLVLLTMCSVAAACGGRQPTPINAQRLVDHYFHRYAKRYHESDLAKNPVKTVTIGPMAEIHKHYVIVLADLTQEHGQQFKANMALEKIYPRGWKVAAWERVELETPPPAPNKAARPRKHLAKFAPTPKTAPVLDDGSHMSHE